jgi:hypothetical protein
MALCLKKPSASFWASSATRPSDKVQALIDRIPGEAAIAFSNNNAGFGRFSGGGLMAVGSRLMALGLGMSEIQGVARELFRFGRDKIGADQMGEIVSGAPGLSQFA